MMDALSRQRLTRLVGKQLTQCTRIERGYTPAEHWRVTFEDGSTAFAKVGSTPATAQWLRAERSVYERISGPFMPKYLGFDDHPERPLLLLEDLTDALWPPPWPPGAVEQLLDGLRAMARVPLTPGTLPELERDRGRFAGWLHVERDAAPFLSLGLCSEGWLAAALPTLLIAQDLAWLGGTDLVHGDLRTDNLCFAGERVVLVDWNGARRGNAAFDLAWLAPSLRLDGGPLPDELLPGEGPLAALICGFFAANAGLPPIPDAPHVRWIQLRQLRIALPWAARALGLTPPDLPWARRATARLDAQLAEGQIDEQRWFEATEEVIGDAYLASDDPRGQCGKSGDEQDFQWSRELILDAWPDARPCALLDVGAANGYLLENLVRWGEQRGITVDPYGLEISPRLAALARRRLPHLAERFAVGNALHYVPQRRFDLVHTGLDYVPPARRRELIEHLFRHYLAPGGRVVLRPERVRDGAPDPKTTIEALGFRIGGSLERRHPSTGAVRRSVWIQPR